MVMICLSHQPTGVSWSWGFMVSHPSDGAFSFFGPLSSRVTRGRRTTGVFMQQPSFLPCRQRGSSRFFFFDVAFGIHSHDIMYREQRFRTPAYRCLNRSCRMRRGGLDERVVCKKKLKAHNRICPFVFLLFLSRLSCSVATGPCLCRVMLCCVVHEGKQH